MLWCGWQNAAILYLVTILLVILRARGVSVHRCDCSSMGHTPEDLERMIEVSWDGSSGESFHVGIDIQAYDRNGLLLEVMAVLSELKITITNINAKVQEDTKKCKYQCYC